MQNVTVEEDFDVEARAIWAILADFADISWIPGLEKVVLEGEGVGMVRHVTAPGLPELQERMDAIDHDRMILDYSVPQVAYLGVKDYSAQVRVVELKGGRCRLVWSCKAAQPDGIDEDEAIRRTEGFYAMVMTWIADALKKSGG